MSHRSFFISLAILILFFSSSARSQNPEPLARPDESANTPIRKKALDLLDLVAGELNTLRSGENRARIGSNVATLLWDHDEQRARRLFAAVGDDIRAGFNETDPDYSARINTVLVFRQLRVDTVNRIVKHDPEFALEFLGATRPPPDMKLPYHLREIDVEQYLELSLARQIAARNPQLALKLGHQSLEKGFSPDLLGLFSQLKQKDKAATLSFYRAIVDKLKNTNLAQNSLAVGVAVRFAQSFPPPEADEQVYRELIAVLFNAALAAGCARAENDNGEYDNAEYVCYQVGSLVPRFETYYGSRAAPMKRFGGDGADTEAGTEPVWEEVQEIIEKGTVEEILALAVKHPGMQFHVYWEAVKKAAGAGDVEKAREIAASLPDEAQRREILARMDRHPLWSSANTEKLAAIQQHLNTLSTNEERLQFLFQAASEVGAKDRKAALALLGQAAQIIDSIKPGKTQLAARITLAALYCSSRSERGFAVLDATLPTLNGLVAAASVLDGFDNTYFREGEWNMTGEGGLGGVLTGLYRNAGCFALMDFDRSLNLANQFERPEIRLMGQLRLAQSVLAKQPLPAVAPIFLTP